LTNPGGHVHNSQVPITLERTPIESQIYAKTLLDLNVSVNGVRRRTGLADITIRNIRDKQVYSPTLLENFKRRLPFKSYRMADDILDCIDVNEIKSAPLGTKMVAFGIAIDKARDMEGSNRPIFNIVSVVNECKQTRDKLEAQMSLVDTRILALQSKQTNVDV